MKTTPIFFILFILSFYSLSQSNNPIKKYYGVGNYPAWTDKIKWGNVINMATYLNGSSDFEKFENARDEIYAQGGGVLYYPAGTYTFSNTVMNGPAGRGLMLKTGVIILGQTPTVDSTAIDGAMTLPTKFVFMKKTKKDISNNDQQIPCDWNMIGLKPSGTEQLKDVNNVGIAWVDMDGGVVYFGPQLSWGATYATAGAWYSSYASFGRWKNRIPDGTHPIDPFAGIGSTKQYVGVGSGRMVFGCILQNSTVVNDSILDFSKLKQFGYYMYKFGSRICAYGKNVFIANNLLPKSTQNFKYQQLTGITQQDKCAQFFGTALSTLIFDYGKTFGIDINKNHLGLASNTNGFYEEGLVVIDNYIYNHGTKGFEISGTWGIINNNKNVRDYLSENDNVYGLGTGWELTLDGWFQSQPGGNGCLSDNLSRAFDLSGKALWIDNNYFNNTGSSPGNDGEGILCQAHGGTQWYSWVVTNNVKGPNGASSYMAGYDVNQEGALIAWNSGAGSYGAINGNLLTDAAYVDNDKTASVSGDVGSDYITTCPSGTLNAPLNTLAQLAVDSNSVIITWTDNTDQEIGYRIDKRFTGNMTWKTVVIRPRRSNGVAGNEQKWIDYNVPRGVNIYYRVVAINCANDNSGAAPETSPIYIDVVNQNEISVVGQQQASLRVYPNPSKGNITIEIFSTKNQNILIDLISESGIKVKNIYSGNVEHIINADISKEAKGFYFIRMIESDGNMIIVPLSLQ